MTNKSLHADFWLVLFSPLILAALVLAYAPLAVLKAWVVSKLWAWYVVPTFEAPTLSVAVAFGLVVLVAFVAKASPPKTERGFWADTALAVAGHLLVLLLGWLGTWFI